MTYYTIVTNFYSVSIYRSAKVVAGALHVGCAFLCEDTYLPLPLSEKAILGLITNAKKVYFSDYPETDDWVWLVERHEGMNS